MKIVIGNYPSATDSRNLILNEEVTDFFAPYEQPNLFTIINKIEGLETAPFRNGTGDWSGADGGYISSQLFSARTITISGAYIDKRANCNESEEVSRQFDHLARLHIRSRLPIRKKRYIRIFLDSGLTFLTEGYCVDIKMDYVYSGYGEYQITMYCPDPALYRGDKDGSLGSEWNTATLRKTNLAGYISSEKEDGVTKYAYMTQVGGENQGIIWHQGGRSTPVMYAGDFPYYPQFIIEPKTNEHITNPLFYSVNEDKYFGLGYPDSDIARLTVTSVNNGKITGLSITDGGAYDADYSGKGILVSEYIPVARTGSEVLGSGASVTLVSAYDSATSLWSFTSVSVKDGGSDYKTGDVLVPQIAGAAILTVSAGQSLVVDMAEHTATLNDHSVLYYMTPGSQWFTLDELTNNNIVFSSADVTDMDYATIRWRNGYQGI